MGRRGLRLISLAAVPVLVLSACGGSTATQTTGATGSTSSTSTATGTPAASVSVKPGNTKVVWFIGLGTGSQPNQLQVETDFINNYNDTNKDHITIVPSIIPNANAIDVLKTQMAAGKGPDIVGPVGIEGRAGFPGVFLDISAEITKQGTDVSVYGDKLLNSMKMGGALIGLPYALYSPFIFYNKDLFAAQALPGLPVKVGDKFNGEDWTWDTLAKYAKQLTVDQNGKKSTDPAFNAAKTKQYGFDMQWVADVRRFATTFGAGAYVAADGKTAQFPAAWGTAIKWYHDAMWVTKFAPNNAERIAADMASGTTMGTGRVAMELAWGWAISSIGSVDAKGTSTSKFAKWDMGVVPTNAGVTTAPVDSDTFSILKSSKVPDQAYKAMIAMEADSSLTVTYGAMPALPSLQAAYFTAQAASATAQFPGNTVTWSVLTEMLKYAANPTHQDPMPNYTKALNLDKSFYTALQSSGSFNVDAEIAKLVTAIQAAFNEPAAS